MKKLNITKEQFNKSRYFKNKYGELEYVSESGRLFKTNKGKVLMFRESWMKDDFDAIEKKWRPKFDIGEKVSLTKEFYEEFYNYYNDVPEKFTKGAYSLDDIPEDGWIIEQAKSVEGREASGKIRPGHRYYITNLDMDDDYDDDSINGIWVYEDWIRPAKGSVKESTKKFGRKFSEAIMGGGKYNPSYDDDEEPLAEWKVGEIVDIDAWQVMWEYDDDERLPEKGWKIVNVERDENYDDCDGYCYTIVNIRNPKLKVEVSASALVERKSAKKSGKNL